MREISTESLKVGEHILIDGVEYVAESDKGHACEGCDLYCNSLPCPIPCGECVMVKVEKPTEEEVKVEKQPTETQDKDTTMTHHELAEWLAKGNGQYRHRDTNAEFSQWIVIEYEEDLAVDDNLLIRPWGTDEWIKPTVEIYRRDCK